MKSIKHETKPVKELDKAIEEYYKKDTNYTKLFISYMIKICIFVFVLLLAMFF